MFKKEIKETCRGTVFSGIYVSTHREFGDIRRGLITLEKQVKDISGKYSRAQRLPGRWKGGAVK